MCAGVCVCVVRASLCKWREVERRCFVLLTFFPLFTQAEGEIAPVGSDTSDVSPFDMMENAEVMRKKYCNTLQHTATHCKILQHSALGYDGRC